MLQDSSNDCYVSRVVAYIWTLEGWLFVLTTRGSKTLQRNVRVILEGRVKSEVVLELYPDESWNKFSCFGTLISICGKTLNLYSIGTVLVLSGVTIVSFRIKIWVYRLSFLSVNRILEYIMSSWQRVAVVFTHQQHSHYHSTGTIIVCVSIVAQVYY
jgi:hypothetical protein